ncbi:MAG: glucose-1-phosphate thymidylyltransferase [Nanoarchaeota archaeon]
MTTVIGIRGYATDESKPELEMQLGEARKTFPQAKIVVALCGQEMENLKKDADKVIHYSNHAIGLTKPWDILIKEAKALRADTLVVVDGDDQHMFSEIKRIIGTDADAIIPEREKRVVFLSNSNISRAALEDLENGFLRKKYGTSIADPQPGLYIIKNPLLQKIDFSTLNPWVGDLALLDQLLSLKAKIASPKVKVRNQNVTALNLESSFAMMKAYQQYFGFAFEEVITASKKDPEHFLQESRLQDIENIRKAFERFERRQQVQQMKGLILAGGFGERLRPITHTVQKQIIPIANKPILFYVIEDLVEVGIKDIGIVIGPNKKQLMEVVGDGSKWNAKITYIEQDSPRGLAHCVMIAKDFLGDEDFVMYLGDNMLRGGITDFVVKFKESGVDASILLTPVRDPERFGIATLNDHGEVEEIHEKPKKPASNLAIIGIYAFKPSIFEACAAIKPSARGELEITDAMQWLLEKGKKITSDLVQGWWKDTGKADALLEVNQLVLDHRMVYTNDGDVHESANVTGRVSIGKNSKILDNSVVRGPVIIGDDCTIGPNAFIGPYTSIGDKVHVAHTEIEHSIVLNECVLKAQKRIVDSVIGKNCQISSAGSSLPSGHKLIIGDNSGVEL